MSTQAQEQKERQRRWDRLEALCRPGDRPFDIGAAALALAHLDHPALADDAAQERCIADMAAALAGLPRGGLYDRAEAMAQVIAHDFGFRGDMDSYDDPANADMISVIGRRRGLPVALSVLYIAAARRCGWGIEGVNFPAHFLVRLTDRDNALILDPFHGGALRGLDCLSKMVERIHGEGVPLRPDHLVGVPDRLVLVRLLNNQKVRAAQAGGGARHLEILRRMTTVAPAHAPCWAECGHAEAQAGNMLAARQALTQALKYAQSPSFISQIEAKLALLSCKIN